LTEQAARQIALTGGLPSHRDKISMEHQQRWASVYIRQSDPRQILHHQESTDVQYALVELAVALGWPRDRVMVIDEDLGKTARLPNHRQGFNRLLNEVALGHVGLIVGVDMSRLARTNQEWYRLFDLCAMVDTRLADRDAVYDARDPNDRMLLGMKSIMSEMELHTMRGRLQRGRMNKAARGELFIASRVGYVILPDGMMDIDPDEEVQAVVRLVFEKFDELGTYRAVFRYLREQQIRLPIRPHTGPQRGCLQWREATATTLENILRHPIYAGVYAHGRIPAASRPAAANGEPCPPQQEWKVFLPDKLPAYISWEKYLENRRRLHANRTLCDTPGMPRNGSALLGGLVVCGRCGRRFQPQYHGRGGRDAYYCCNTAVDVGRTDPCPGIKVCVLDNLVAQQVLLALEPASLELSLEAARNVQRERERLDQHWRQQLQRAAYEASRAERQYEAVEPENRLVARTLEQRWEAALCRQRQLQEDYARFQQQQPLPPTAAQCAVIERLASDIPALWHSTEITSAERGQIVRCLLRRVKVHVERDSEHVDVTLHWQGGFTSQHALLRPVAHYTQLRDYDRLLKRVSQLWSEGEAAREIARRLDAEGFRPPRAEHFTPEMVRRLWRRSRRGDLSDHEWRMSSLSRRLSIPETRVRDWIRRGWVHARKSGRTWIAWADSEELRRLTQLSLHQQANGRFHRYPAELTTPKQRPGSSSEDVQKPEHAQLAVPAVEG
jgi:DNA invertase Pin-like site-specific DNA recombinase